MATKARKIYNWNMARGNFESGFNYENEFLMLQEELLEFGGLERRTNIFSRFIKYITVRLRLKHIGATEHDKVDALADIIVVATGSIYKLGYDADLVMEEVIREISSRQQDPIQARLWSERGINGEKWMKDKNQDPKTIKKARFDRCKLGEHED